MIDFGFQPFTEFCKTPTDYANVANAESSFIYQTYLMQLALNMYKYENLPDTIDPFYLEFILITQGYILFYNDPRLGYVVTQCTLGGQINHQMQPTQYHTVDPSGVLNKEISIDEGVLIKNSPLYLPMEPYIRYYAKMISLCSRTMEENLEKQWTPYIITGDKRQMNSFKQFMNQIKKGVSTIFAGKGLDPTSLGILNTTAPYISNDINTTKQNILRECMTVLGIDNANQDKKERVQTAEVNSNNSQIIASRNIWFNERKKAIEKINEKYKLNIEVSFRAYDDLKDLIDINDNSIDYDFIGGDEDE